MGVLKWISGMVQDVETYLANEEKIVKADLAPLMANIGSEFRDALGKFAEAEYAAFKSIVGDEFAKVKAANPSATVFELAKLVGEAALPALESGGMKIAETALLQFVVSLL